MSKKEKATGQFLGICFLAWQLLAGSAPSSAQQTVGNGTVMAPSAGQREAYDLNNAETSGQSDFATRHFRRGTSAGIGGSFLQTTSPTSESSPAMRQIDQQPQTANQIRLPVIQSSFSATTINPALNSFTPALPQAPSSSALIAPSTGAAPFGSQRSGGALEELPSFSRKQSLMDQMRF